MALAFLRNKRPGVAKVPHSHNAKVILEVVPPTCTEMGYTVYGCSCGQGHSIIGSPFLESLGHLCNEYLKYDAEAHCTVCERCGEMSTFPHVPNYSLEDLPEDEPQVCLTCGYEMRPALHIHNWSDWRLTKAATCEEAGEWERSCDCGKVETKDIPALGHDMISTVIREPSCISKGEKYNSCKRCGYNTTEEIEVVAHTREKIPAVPATCTVAGSTEGERCSVCSTFLIEPQTILPYHIPSDITYKKFNDERHMKSQTCTRCGEVLLAEREPHTWGMSDTGTSFCVQCGATK